MRLRVAPPTCFLCGARCSLGCGTQQAAWISPCLRLLFLARASTCYSRSRVAVQPYDGLGIVASATVTSIVVNSNDSHTALHAFSLSSRVHRLRSLSCILPDCRSTAPQPQRRAARHLADLRVALSLAIVIRMPFQPSLVRRRPFRYEPQFAAKTVGWRSSEPVRRRDDLNPTRQPRS